MILRAWRGGTWKYLLPKKALDGRVRRWLWWVSARAGGEPRKELSCVVDTDDRAHGVRRVEMRFTDGSKEPVASSGDVGWDLRLYEKTTKPVPVESLEKKPQVWENGRDSTVRL